MQGYPNVSPPAPPKEGHKNYVFVDEHNRHKRLKVMRACNGCRKRKIKCDAATTNTWPCSACTRLKIVCVPPTSLQEGDSSSMALESEATQVGLIGSSTPDAPHYTMANRAFRDNIQVTAGHTIPCSHGMDLFRNYAQAPHSQQNVYGDVRASHITTPHSAYQNSQVFPAAQGHLGAPDPGISTADSLSEVLGELKMDESGIAPYIRQQKKGCAGPDTLVQDEAEDTLPPLCTRAGSRVGIPPELMPSDEEALNYFKIYFRDIHPYVPVIHRSHFYWQWENDRDSISPLLLESLFASASRFSDSPAQSAQWLALANKHESSFMDVPRLSTIQAMLLLLKARESTPKKGYFYRSWQAVKTMISMSKDLDIHEHHGTHAEGKPCALDPVECLEQTRVWQTLLVVEAMVGGPQGRSDYGVDLKTVDIRPTLDIAGLDQFEINCSKQYAYFVQNASHLRILTDLFHKVKRNADWAADPRFMANSPLFTDWFRNLPPDLQVNYPADGSPPWIPSHFVAHMHCYCHLGIIGLHRPQLLTPKSFAGGDWKVRMALCYSSAKKICRLQEAILRHFGLPGLLFMQRGISFTIYATLACTMLHLVAITSPDPDLHRDAREFFTRHMRILELCSPAWPMPEIQAQIDSLRLAFSANINYPFELKPSFPYGSPSEAYPPSPLHDSHYNDQLNSIPNTIQNSMGYSTHPLTPVSVGTGESKSDPSQIQSFGVISQTAPLNQHFNAPLVDEDSWDPTRIINQWNTAFANAPTAVSTDSLPAAINDIPQTLPNPATNQYSIQYGLSSNVPSISSAQSVSQPPFNGQQQLLMIARDWQHKVASVYDPHGLKRRWDYSVNVETADLSKHQR